MPEPPQTYEAVLRRALNLLKSRNYLEAELKLRLESEDCPKEVVDSVLQFLIERRFLDDQRTIEQTVDRASGRRAIGRNKLQNELIARGLPAEEAKQAVRIRTDTEEQSIIAELLEKKGRIGADRARYGRFLLSRGFESEAVDAALNQFFGDED